RRVDYEQLTSSEISNLLNEVKSVFPDDKYRLGHSVDWFDEVLSVYLNRTSAERVKKGGNPFVGNDNSEERNRRQSSHTLSCIIRMDTLTIDSLTSQF